MRMILIINTFRLSLIENDSHYQQLYIALIRSRIIVILTKVTARDVDKYYVRQTNPWRLSSEKENQTNKRTNNENKEVEITLCCRVYCNCFSNCRRNPKLWRLKMKRLIMILPFLILGCNEEQVTEAAIASPSNEVPADEGSVHKAVTVWGGHEFECFMFNDVTGQVWCNEPNYPTDVSLLNIGSASFVLIAEHATAFYDIIVKDDSVCFSGQASHSPVQEWNSVSTYCIGQNTMGDPSAYSTTIKYPFNPAVNGSPEIAWTHNPFVGADLAISQLMATGTIGDDNAYVSSYDLQCEFELGILTCPNFTVDTN